MKKAWRKARSSRRNLARLWKHYQEVIFLNRGGRFPSLSFVILTAENPFGKRCRISPGGTATKLFLAGFTRHVPALLLDGCSRDLRHRELSFACKMNKRDARFLAKKLQQNAYYRVSFGRLRLEAAAAMQDFPAMQLGNFQRRLFPRSQDTS